MVHTSLHHLIYLLAISRRKYWYFVIPKIFSVGNPETLRSDAWKTSTLSKSWPADFAFFRPYFKCLYEKQKFDPKFYILKKEDDFFYKLFSTIFRASAPKNCVTRISGISSRFLLSCVVKSPPPNLGRYRLWTRGLATFLL